MTCNEVDALITEYLEDAMPQPVRADFEAHLAACTECQNRLGDTRALIEASHNVGEKLSQDWRTRTPSQTAEQYVEKLEARLLAESRPAGRPFGKLAPVAAAIVVSAVAAVVWIHVHNARLASVPLNLTVDLTRRGPVRGAEQPEQPPIVFPRRILDLNILMPIDYQPGDYRVALARDGQIRLQPAAPGTSKNGITTVHVRMDCRHLSKGSYTFLARYKDWGWTEFPAVVH